MDHRRYGIPSDVVFRTKHDLALDLIVGAVDDKVPGDIVLADSAYGDSYEFREAVQMLGFDYAVGIHATTSMWPLDAQEHYRGEPLTARAIADALSPRALRTITWRDGTMPGKRGRLRSRFHFCRVKVAHDDARLSRSSMARHRMARGGEGPQQVRAHDATAHYEQEADRAHLQGALPQPNAPTKK